MPSGTTLKKLYWVYVLVSERDGEKYVGFTTNPSDRIQQHNEGYVFSTRPKRPLHLIYIEGCLNENDARRREKYMKTTYGRRFLAKRMKTHFSQNS